MTLAETKAFETIKTIAENTSSSVKVEKLVDTIYWKLVSEGHHPVVVNEKYLEVWEENQHRSGNGEKTFYFRRNNKMNCWKVCQF